MDIFLTTMVPALQTVAIYATTAASVVRTLMGSILSLADNILCNLTGWTLGGIFRHRRRERTWHALARRRGAGDNRAVCARLRRVAGR
jgi:hypothetical protein